MKYTLTIDIDQSRERVVELFCEPKNMPEWQPEFVSFDQISGDAYTEGSKAKFVSKMGKRNIEMIGTIVHINLPDEYFATFETKGVWNRVDSRFVEIGENKTRWEFDCEFRCSGFIKLMAWLMPGMFRKQSYISMERFKSFAESVKD
jgi:hypothetical protein